MMNTKRWVVLAGSATLGMAVLTAPNATASATPATEATTSVQAGDCLLLTAKESRTSNLLPSADRLVDCSEPHNTQVTAVRALPDNVARSGRDSAVMNAWVARTCYATVSAVTTQPTHAFWSNWYTPSKAQWAAGERTVICTGNTEKRVGAKFRPDTTTGVYTRAKFTPTCRVFRGSWVLASCGARKAVELLVVKPLPYAVDAAYPGRAPLLKLAKRWADGRGWSVGASKKEWNDGQRFVWIYG